MKSLFFGLISFFLGLMGCKEAPKSSSTPLAATEAIKDIQLASEPRIIPIEHATAVILWGETTIYVDPVGGTEALEGQPKPDLILITDIHGDHLNVETLAGLDTDNARIVAPNAVAEQLPQALGSRVGILENGDTAQHSGILVEAIPMYNLREEAKDFHVKGRGNGYVLQKDGYRLYISGDTEDIPEMRALEDIDLALVCMNLPYTMTVESAASAVLEFAPAKVYPYHFRGRPEVSDVGRFRELVSQGNADIQVIQLDWYPNDEF